MAVNIPKEPPSTQSQQNTINNAQALQKVNFDKQTGMAVEKIVKGPEHAKTGKKPKNDVFMGNYECQTCANRAYQDGSSDMGVSMKSPTKIAPEAAAAAVANHESEHISRDRASAQSEGREVVSQSVRIFMDVCPECGRPYVSGGEARTVSKSKSVRDQENVHRMPSKQQGGKVDIKL